MNKQETIMWIMNQTDFIKKSEDNEKLMEILNKGLTAYDSVDKKNIDYIKELQADLSNHKKCINKFKMEMKGRSNIIYKRVFKEIIEECGL